MKEMGCAGLKDYYEYLKVHTPGKGYIGSCHLNNLRCHKRHTLESGFVLTLLVP